ncbi:manganese catalase family protein, partial [Bacillus haynesii]|nr:manganese catalase family protein [Bacillus haynesii]
MFFHIKELQYHAKPEKPDPLFAKKLQEILGGQFGEISVALQYLFQGWSVRGNGKYKDLLMD